MSMPEPQITINGVALTQAQAMAVRVAITSYHSEMCNPTALGEDATGRGITKGYHTRLSEVLSLIFGHPI